MKTIAKIILTIFILSVASAIVLGVDRAFSSNYAVNASFVNSIGILCLACLAMIILFLIARSIWVNLSIIIIVSLLSGCQYAKSNQQVLVSEDCGSHWKKINIGDAVPRGGVNPCYMKVVIPNFPMQGDSKFITNMSEKVRVYVHIDYDYSIIDPLSFIYQAKYLGSVNKQADDNQAIDPSAFEMAENTVIDKRIREVAKGLFLDQDIVDIEQADIEAKLQEKINKILEPLGVKLNFITLTFEPDEQTRQAIDVCTAMKIYESRSLTDLGQKIMVARAGAAKFNFENKTQTEPAKNQE